jgi:tetratricopeptide (TPR) repeat protein
MNRFLALMLPLGALLAGVAGSATRSGSTPVQTSTDLAVSWKASLAAETNKDYDEALNQLRVYLAGGGDKFMATLRAGWLMYSKGDYTGANLNYGNASRMQPTALNPLLGLMYTAIALNDRVKIMQTAENVLKVEPTNYKGQVAIAEVCYSSGDYHRARSAYRRVLAYYPDDAYAINGASWSALLTGERAEAVEGFKKLLSMNPDYPNAADGLMRAGSTARVGAAGSLTAARPN